MNTKKLHKTIITVFVIISFSDLCIAQFETNTVPPGPDFGRTQYSPVPFAGNRIFSVGIGNFNGAFPGSGGLFPLSALHVNTNLMPLSPNHGPGEVFRTDCPSLNDSYWRMFRGANPRGNIFSPVVSISGQEDFVIENPQKDCNILLRTGFFPRTRMTITDGGTSSPTFGFIGIGPNFYTPQSLLHLHDVDIANFSPLPTYLQITTLGTGSAATNGLKIGVNTLNTAEIRQQEDAPIDFFTNTTATRKVRIWHNAADEPRVGIGPLNGSLGVPLTYLHLGDGASNSNGFRTWMNVGTYYDDFSDNMYVGLRRIGPAGSDRHDAIINWGNNPVDPANIGNTDRLRFVFTTFAASTGTPKSLSFDGMEVCRMTAQYDPLGNLEFGRTGIGDFFSPITPPLTNEPRNALEIRANTDAIGNITDPSPSGLRFSYLTSASTPVAIPPTTNVLSVNQDGDVILIPGSTGLGFGGVCGTNPAGMTNDFEIPTNKHNFIFTNNQSQSSSQSNVGIGLPSSSCNPVARLDVLQKSTNQGTIGLNVENRDQANNSAGVPVIGIRSLVNNFGVNCFKVAGWFEARNSLKCAGGTAIQYAIVVPNNSGVASIGFSPALVSPNTPNLLQVNGTGISAQSAWNVLSDSILKKDVSVFSDGLNVIRQIHPVNYRYNGLAGIDTTGSHIGVIAEEIQTIAPYTIGTFSAKLDSSDANFTDLLTINSGPFLYTSINAIKQLDSALTKATSVPDAPVLISPADGSAGSFRGTTFTWHSVSAGVVLYRAQLAKDNAFTNIEIDQSGITDTTTTFFVCDSLPGTHYWRVNAKNNTGTGAWSEVFSFTDTVICLPIGPLPFDTIRPRTAVAFNSSSDSRFKTNVASITNALDKVSQLSGVNYDWIQTPGYEFDSARQIGFIAQDVQSVVPEVIHTDANGNLTLDYGRIVPVLVEAIKEQQVRIIALEGGGSRTNENGQTEIEKIKLSLPDAPVLGDARPNPNSGYAEIAYYMPEGTTSAKIIFIDMLGRTMQEKTIQAGYGIIGIDTKDLPSGNYYYSLILNGNKIETKTMVKTK